MDSQNKQTSSSTNLEAHTKIVTDNENNPNITGHSHKPEDAFKIGDIIYYGSNSNSGNTHKCHIISNNVNNRKGGIATLNMVSSLFDAANKSDGTTNGYPTNNSASPSKNTLAAFESLEDILKDLNLYEELYDFMKSKNITPDALKYMQSRHIDELFNGSELSLKIIFEHRLDVWQKRRKQYNQKDVSMIINHNSCHTNKCQLMTIKYSNGTNSSYHILGSNDLTSLSNRLMEVIQNGLDDVLMEFKSSVNPHNLNSIEESAKSTELPLEPLLQTEDVCLTEKLNIISVETVAPEIPQSSVSVILEPELIEPLTGEDTELVDSQNELEPIVQSISEQKNLEHQVKDQISMANKPSQHIINSNMLEPSAISHNNKRKWGIETEVKEILLMYKPGNYVLKSYKTHGELTPQLRNDLMHIIVDHFVFNSEFVSVTQCRSLAEEIVQLFPTESMETYFSQENRSLSPRGKLWNLYQNQRRTQKKDSYTQYSKSNQFKMELACEHLKNIKDESYKLKKWNTTFHYRRYQLQSGHFTNWKMYFDAYPFCKQQNYSRFIDADLSTLYSDLSFDEELWNDFINNFRIFFWNKIKHEPSKQLFEKLSSMDEMCTPSDYFPIKISQLLHAVLNNTSCLEEAQRQFTVEVSDLIELKEIVIDRKKHCLENKLQCKPYIAVVRENNTYVHYSVILDSTGFGCDNFKESLILCFKLYLFFDISYPTESFSVWLFIQKYFFNKLSLIVDTTVDAFINDIRSQTKVNLEITT